MSIEVTYDEHDATFVTRPDHGRAVTFTVTRRDERYLVGLKGSTGEGFSQHTSYEVACSRALTRARRYDRAYSVPRRLAVAS